MAFIFEEIVNDTETVITDFFIQKDRSGGQFGDYVYWKNNTVYSRLLDEILNFVCMTIIEDSVSTIYIFRLAEDTYTMSSAHTIGLKNFGGHDYIIEINKAAK